MSTISQTELQKRLRKLESAAVDTSDTTVLANDQYELAESVVYVAYASALSNLANSKIPNQSDASDFQYAPYNANGVLLAFRGFHSSKSVYQSGDPTDYTWEGTSGLSGFTSSERFQTASPGLLSLLGNPTNPGNGVTWTVINPGSAVPSAAAWVAERFTVGGVTSGWTIEAVGAFVNASVLVANAVTTAKIANDAVTADKLANSINTAIAASGNQTTTLTGDVTGSGSGSFAATIGAGKVITSKILNANVTTDKIANDSVTVDKLANSINTAIAANTAKTGITSSQANAITANTAKTGISSAQTSAITANTAKTGITSSQITKLNGIEASAKADQTQSEINALGITATGVDLGNWTITETSGVLLFATGGTNKMKLEANGNLTCVGTVTAEGSI